MNVISRKRSIFRVILKGYIKNKDTLDIDGVVVTKHAEMLVSFQKASNVFSHEMCVCVQYIDKTREMTSDTRVVLSLS